jgi:Asp-tRNA(Asn)/Glu-tRNA(Gln) amidotransferase A subunit family amidase
MTRIPHPPAERATPSDRALEALADDLGIVEGVDRRRFLKLAATVAAATGLAPAALPEAAGLRAAPAVGLAPGASRRPSQEAPAQVPLGNGEPPAFTFQAWPGGTGDLMQRMFARHGAAMFDRAEMTVAPWSGPVPTDEEEIAFLPVSRLAALIREGHISPTELTEIYLERIQRYDPVLLCAVSILPDRAREEAQQAEADLRSGGWKGPLHGIPYGMKDLFAVSGTRTTWGAADFQDQLLDYDSEVVVRLREAGAVLIAKLATGEFARGDRWYRGRTLNPWNLEQGSSGSSAGPGSATAAGCVAFAIGTETQGSIVSPARRNGLSALRPTFGRVSRHGGMVLAWSMDKVGPMCRSIEDCALVFNAIHGADPKDPGSVTTPFNFDRNVDLGALSIGYDDDAPESFVSALRELGADPRPVPEVPRGGSNALGVESAAAFDFHVGAAYDAAIEAGEEPEGARFTGGRDDLALDYLQSQRRRHLLQREMATFMEEFDLFVSGRGEIGLTNQTGHPSVVVPYAFGGEVPQPQTTVLIGDLFRDDLLLGVAHRYQVTTDWHLRRPDLSSIG